MGDPRYFGGTIPFIKIADVTSSNGLVVYDSETKVTSEGALRSRLLKKGSLILTNSATVCVPVFLGADACIHDGFVAFDGLPDFVDQKYLFYFFKFIRPFVLAAHKQGVTQVNLNTGIVGDMRLLLSPWHEQRRIVAKIEELFSELDKGVESLTTAREQLKAYRQSVLKNAFEGKLTADWRAENADKLESSEALLARIKKEREDHYNQAFNNWQAAFAKWRADSESGQKPAKPRPLKDYPPEFHDLRITLPEIPNGWAWAHLGWCSMGPEYGTAAKSSETGAVPVVRMGNLQNGRIEWDDLVYTSDEHEIAQYSLRPGDVLFNRTNSPELVGKTSIYKGERPALFAGYLVRVNQIETIALGKYLTYFLGSPIAREHGNTVKTDGVNQSNINGTKLQEYPYPFCSVAEQAKIIQILDSKLEAADVMEAEIEAGLARANALRQSILRRAFSGQLVAQEPADEPASELLERIRAEREGGGATKRRNNKNGKKEAA
jgi:type I restriction enzyme S subunit